VCHQGAAQLPTKPQLDHPTWESLNADVIACRACPRLVKWREQVAREKRRAYQDWDYWGKPVPGFGDVGGQLFIVGLAPGAHGSNRTGRPFSGDSSGNTLFAALHRSGFANQPTGLHRGDGLRLSDAYITSVGRCAPPKNRPTAQELANCRPYLEQEWRLMPQIRVILALGQMAFDGCLRLLADMGHDLPKLKFGHGLHHPLTEPPGLPARHLLASYHPSRQNTQTGRLTPDMLDDVFNLARSLLTDGP
jgi:uracil-DNA glycosylase family 4